MKSNGLRSRHQRRLRPTAPRGRTRAGHGLGREHGLLCRLRLHAPARLGRRATELVRHAATRPRPSSTVTKLCSPPPSVHTDLADPHRSDALFSAVTGPRPLPMRLAPGLAWPRAAGRRRLLRCAPARPQATRRPPAATGPLRLAGLSRVEHEKEERRTALAYCCSMMGKQTMRRGGCTQLPQVSEEAEKLGEPL